MNKSKIIPLIIEDGIPFHKTSAFHEDHEAGRIEVLCVPNYTWIKNDYQLDGVGYLTLDHLAAALRAMIANTGLDQKEIAAILNVSKQTVSRWCTGKTAIPEKAWIEIELYSKSKRSTSTSLTLH